MLEQYVKMILTSRVYDVAVETPLQAASKLSERLGNQILLKREDLQPVYSFKIRGAYNKLAQLSAEERARGVVTASAGNHAQGLALAAKVLGVKATIVMPKTTPEIKVQGVRSRGGKVVLHGDSFPEALAFSLKLVEEKGYIYIHPYDDPHTIAGQGTVAMEILRQQPGQLDAIFVPVGGGGAIKDIYDDTRSITEPAGALSVAGIKKYVEREGCSGQVLVGIDSGANVNFDRLRHVAERAELGEKREAIIAVTIPEQPGSFKAFCEAIGKRQITEFNYRYHTDREAHIFVGVQTHPETDPRAALVESLRSQGFPVQDLTDNELAKLHIRHMVGGHAAAVPDEVVLRFEFPERPGALFNFLQKLGGRWNISMFHYRNHGAADGRVVAGLQVPSDERHLLPAALEAIVYPYWDESDNPAYKLFLG